VNKSVRQVVLILVATGFVFAATFLPVFSQPTSTATISGSMGGASQTLSPSQKDLGAWTDINIKAREFYAKWRERYRDELGP